MYRKRHHVLQNAATGAAPSGGAPSAPTTPAPTGTPASAAADMHTMRQQAETNFAASQGGALPPDVFAQLLAAPTPEAAKEAAYTTGFTAEDIAKAAQAQDFLSAVPPALTARISAGGADAVAATQEMMQLVARHATGLATQGGAAITERAIADLQAKMDAKIEAQLAKRMQATDLASGAEAFTNPHAKQLAMRIANNMQQMNPTMDTKTIWQNVKATLETMTGGNGGNNTATKDRAWATELGYNPKALGLPAGW